MKVLIDQAELDRLMELEQLLLDRMQAESAESAADKVLLIAQMRMRMFAHVNNHIGIYRPKLSGALFQHVQRCEHRSALKTVNG